MIRIITIIFTCSIAGFAQDRPAYKLFTKEGRPVEYEKVIQVLAKAEIILFGEIHNNSINHWLELQVLKDLHAIRNDLTIGMEMFEADDQIVLTEYLQGLIDERHLLNEAKIWDNYMGDYKPLIEFAKERKVAVIATNIPRRYASLVFKKGTDALSELPAEARKWIAPLPLEVDLSLPGYKEMLSDGAHGSNGNTENMAKSQASKDATMAHFILQNRKGSFLHINGTYHSKNYEGIFWYLKKAEPKLNIVTIHTVEQDSIDKLEEANRNSADYIICVPKDMTKTY